MATLGVTFNGKHSLTDWGLHWQAYNVTAPVPITSYIDIPGRKTKLDATESLFGSVTYEHRTLTFIFWKHVTWPQFVVLDSQIQNAIGGRKVKVITDIEKDKYWMGRATVSGSMTADNYKLATWTITVDAEPFKYLENTPGADWLWDPFSFRDGVVQNLNNIQVSGSKTQAVIGTDRPATPTVTATADMKVAVDGKTYDLKANEPKTLDAVVLYKGTTNFQFTGTGKVTISFRGETL